MQPTVLFDITNMDAKVREGIDLVWNGRRLNSGPLHVRLDDQAVNDGDNRGELDYETSMARARFNLRIDLYGLAKRLAGALYCEFIEPIRAVVYSEGVITQDHNFGFSGPMKINPHPLFGAEEVSALVLPGR
jgi:hypothetical protein